MKSFTSTTDGHNLFHGLSFDGETITGVTRNGGHHSFGTLFSVKNSGADFTVLHHFGHGLDGRHPYNGPVRFGHVLYGMTFLGGKHAAGVLYGYDIRTGTHGVRHSYGTTLGYYPFTNETLPLDDEGVIFRLDGVTNAYEVIHDFRLVVGDGAKPNSAMLVGSDGWLYGIAHGTEIWGGAGYEFGTLYRLRPDGSDFEVLHTFDSMANGNTPMRGVLEIDGHLYGATAFGGAGTGVGNGTVWRYALPRG